MTSIGRLSRLDGSTRPRDDLLLLRTRGSEAGACATSLGLGSFDGAAGVLAAEEPLRELLRFWVRIWLLSARTGTHAMGYGCSVINGSGFQWQLATHKLYSDSAANSPAGNQPNDKQDRKLDEVRPSTHFITQISYVQNSQQTTTQATSQS